MANGSAAVDAVMATAQAPKVCTGDLQSRATYALRTHTHTHTHHPPIERQPPNMVKEWLKIRLWTVLHCVCCIVYAALHRHGRPAGAPGHRRFPARPSHARRRRRPLRLQPALPRRRRRCRRRCLPQRIRLVPQQQMLRSACMTPRTAQRRLPPRRVLRWRRQPSKRPARWARPWRMARRLCRTSRVNWPARRRCAAGAGRFRAWGCCGAACTASRLAWVYLVRGQPGPPLNSRCMRRHECVGPQRLAPHTTTQRLPGLRVQAVLQGQRGPAAQTIAVVGGAAALGLAILGLVLTLAFTGKRRK
jgi:hypothetical protein